MKNIIKLLFLLIFSQLSVAQETYKSADKLFDRMWYADAAKAYETAIGEGDQSMEVLQKVGDAYYFNTDMVNANKWYDLLINDYLEQVDPEYIFRFAHSLQGIEENKSAKKWMKLFAKKAKQDDVRIKEYAQQQKTLNDVLDIRSQFTLKNLDINTKYSDFGPMYYNNKLVYSSAIDSSTFHTRTYKWTNQPYLNFYTAKINATKAEVDLIGDFSESLNTKFHEATLAFSPDNKKIYFTRNNYDGDLERDDNGVNHLKLYSAEKADGLDNNSGWVNIKELPFNSLDYSVGHPTVSKDGKQLYFASDMPGTVGATDIFVVDILGNDNYSEPKNLGTKINTSGNEMFPYITDRGLYFASNGHLGQGGLDVFESVKQNGLFTDVINLGAPLNTKSDDFGFIINEADNTGFVCSNRALGKGDDDIYSFTRDEIEEIKEAVVQQCSQFVKGYVTNSKTGERISSATVMLYSDKGEKLSETLSKVNGDFAFNYDLDCNARYEVLVSKTGYKPNEKDFVTSEISKETIVPLAIETLDQLIVEDKGLLKIKIGIIYFDLDKYAIRYDSAIELNKVVLLMTQYPNMKITVESHTDSRSPDDYNLTLSSNRAQSTKDYIVSQGIDAKRILSATGYGETKLVNNCSNGVKCTEQQHQMNRRSEFIIIQM